MPWLKYYICCNPWIYDLEHRMVQQISTSMEDCADKDLSIVEKAEQIADRARTIITRARQARDTAEHIDIWSFVPHYPYPPPDRRWALGLQAGGSTYPGKFTLIVHTTHACADAQSCTEQFVLSNSVACPVYRVMLWYNNPYHFLTGWVEASITNGKPSQPDKVLGGEHPMWLVTAKTKQVSGRESWTGSGMIDAFFDYWLPAFVHECRRLTYAHKLREQYDDSAKAKELAAQIADAYYQEVHSQDGVSRPIAQKIGREHYDRKDALTDFVNNAENQRNSRLFPIMQTISDALAHLADTDGGLKPKSFTGPA